MCHQMILFLLFSGIRCIPAGLARVSFQLTDFYIALGL